LTSVGSNQFDAVHVNGKYMGYVDELDGPGERLLLDHGGYTVRIAPVAGGQPHEKTVVIRENRLTLVNTKVWQEGDRDGGTMLRSPPLTGSASMESKSGKASDSDRVRREGDDRTPPPAISDLIRQNEKLTEGVRQLRVALALWTEVAVRTVMICEYQREKMETTTPLLGKAVAADLVRLLEALRAKIAETAPKALMTEQGENRNQREKP
jgi:hypothetical protein